MLKYFSVLMREFSAHLLSTMHSESDPVQNWVSTGMWRSQPISASVGFHVQNPSDADADLLRSQNYELF